MRPYKALSGERNPALDTVLRVVGALGLKSCAEPALDSDAAEQGAGSPNHMGSGRQAVRIT